MTSSIKRWSCSRCCAQWWPRRSHRRRMASPGALAVKCAKMRPAGLRSEAPSRHLSGMHVFVQPFNSSITRNRRNGFHENVSTNQFLPPSTGLNSCVPLLHNGRTSHTASLRQLTPTALHWAIFVTASDVNWRAVRRRILLSFQVSLNLSACRLRTKLANPL